MMVSTLSCISMSDEDEKGHGTVSNWFPVSQSTTATATLFVDGLQQQLNKPQLLLNNRSIMHANHASSTTSKPNCDCYIETGFISTGPPSSENLGSWTQDSSITRINEYHLILCRAPDLPLRSSEYKVHKGLVGCKQEVELELRSIHGDLYQKYFSLSVQLYRIDAKSNSRKYSKTALILNQNDFDLMKPCVRGEEWTCEIFPDHGRCICVLRIRYAGRYSLEFCTDFGAKIVWKNVLVESGSKLRTQQTRKKKKLLLELSNSENGNESESSLSSPNAVSPPSRDNSKYNAKLKKDKGDSSRYSLEQLEGQQNQPLNTQLPNQFLSLFLQNPPVLPPLVAPKYSTSNNTFLETPIPPNEYPYHFCYQQDISPKRKQDKKSETDSKNILPPEQKGRSCSVQPSSQSAFRSIKRLRDEMDDNGVTETDSCYYQPQLKQARLLSTITEISSNHYGSNNINITTATNSKDSITNSNLSLLLNCIPVAINTLLPVIPDVVVATTPTIIVPIPVVVAEPSETVMQQAPENFDSEPMLAETFNTSNCLETANANVNVS